MCFNKTPSSESNQAEKAFALGEEETLQRIASLNFEGAFQQFLDEVAKEKKYDSAPSPPSRESFHKLFYEVLDYRLSLVNHEQQYSTIPQILDKFLDYQLPMKLSAFERRWVHFIADHFDLDHSSRDVSNGGGTIFNVRVIVCLYVL